LNRALPALRIPSIASSSPSDRWRGIAEDGREFGFALDAPLADRAAVFASDTGVYLIAQKYEPVLEVALGTDAPAAARLGWIIAISISRSKSPAPIVRVPTTPRCASFSRANKSPSPSASASSTRSARTSS